MRSLRWGWAICLLASPVSAGELLHVYTSIDAQEASEYFQAFTRASGIEVRSVRLSAGEALTRLRAERQRPQASVWFGGPYLDYMVAAEDGLFAPYQPRGLTTFPAGGHDATWRWVGAYLGLIGFVSHPELLGRGGLKPPSSWAELTAPGMKNEVSLAYAYTSGTAYLVVAALVELWGERAALDYFARLNANVHHYNRSGAACVTQVALREIGTCVAFSQDIVMKGLRRGYPLHMSFPAEGTAAEVGGLAIIADAPEAQLAQVLVEWLLSPEAQRLMSAKGRIPIRADVPGPDGIPALEAVKLISLDAAKAAGKRKHLIEAWREATEQ